MSETRLPRIQERLAAMQQRNDALRDELKAKQEHLEKMKDAQRETLEKLKAAREATVKRLDDEVTQTRSLHAVELAKHQAELEALANRRRELKEDFGDLYELYGQLTTAAEGVEG